MSADVVSNQSLDASENIVPKDNTELYTLYSSYVQKLVTRHNRVLSNYKDLLQHVWVKLIEVDVLKKYSDSLGHLPKYLSGAQVATYLKLPWASFLERVASGVEKECLYARVYARDQGVCHRCNKDMVKLTSALTEIKAQVPEKYEEVTSRILEQLGVSSIPERFWVVETNQSGDHTTCLFCALHSKVSGVSYRWYPVPQKGHWTNPQSLYVREEVERLRLVLDTEGDRPVDVDADPSSVLSKSLFKQYLARSVHNIYANWCRTRERRYKETYRGNDEATGRSWEDTLSDPFGARQETVLDLTKAVRFIAGSGDPDKSSREAENEVLDLLDSGKSVQEVARRRGVRPRSLQSILG
jgi:hypothetical protein